MQYAAGGRTAAQAQQEQLIAMILGRTGAEGGQGGQGLTGSLFTSEMLRVLAAARRRRPQMWLAG